MLEDVGAEMDCSANMQLAFCHVTISESLRVASDPVIIFGWRKI